MAKQQEPIKNVFDGQLDGYDRKYLRFFAQDFHDRVSTSVFSALRSKNIAVIEDTLKDLSNSAANVILLIGLSCLVIERERLYEGTEFGLSYLRYADHLFDELNIPVSTLSDAKLIVENYLDHYKGLSKAGFKLARNTTKLLYLPKALENHPEEEVYNRIVNSTFREFRAWAQKKRIAQRSLLPEMEKRVAVRVEGDKLYINGKNLLNFPPEVSDTVKGYISEDLSKTFSIREGGNEPFIIPIYGKGEQRAIERFLKKYQASK
jgi:hypothetical protein